jgi:hypothetical protein
MSTTSYKFMVQIPYAPGAPIKQWAKEVTGIDDKSTDLKGFHKVLGRFLRPGGHCELQPGSVILLGWNPTTDTRAARLMRVMADGSIVGIAEVEGDRLADRLMPDIRRCLGQAATDVDELRQAVLTVVRIMKANPHLADVACAALATHGLELKVMR